MASINPSTFSPRPSPSSGLTSFSSHFSSFELSPLHNFSGPSLISQIHSLTSASSPLLPYTSPSSQIYLILSWTLISQHPLHHHPSLLFQFLLNFRLSFQRFITHHRPRRLHLISFHLPFINIPWLHAPNQTFTTRSYKLMAPSLGLLQSHSLI